MDLMGLWFSQWRLLNIQVFGRTSSSILRRRSSRVSAQQGFLFFYIPPTFRVPTERAEIIFIFVYFNPKWVSTSDSIYTDLCRQDGRVDAHGG